ncbi:PREDICTED: THAP domain-containing protein 5-like isoform X1 [Polistes dominula]|uniref:THAP domain-containing protein 5-like isoform X1 n=1 Tax=Polistes dominula TaxID=743375 RepID=A0ABM1J0R2_POLDO|nr:PREDICTED: THAP domain-containing protein 5-like isoform X1 [Polistes dominula]XP_015186049.1 PREDICTED: THAP domain-containing protein 5-like isoform X1 [Polistes dominula]
MVRQCILNYCKSSTRTTQDRKFCRFPKHEERRKLWLQNSNVAAENVKKYSVLCDKHFSEDCWKIVNGKRCLKNTAVPTIFIQSSTLTDKKGVTLSFNQSILKRNVLGNVKNNSDLSNVLPSTTATCIPAQQEIMSKQDAKSISTTKISENVSTACPVIEKNSACCEESNSSPLTPANNVKDISLSNVTLEEHATITQPCDTNEELLHASSESIEDTSNELMLKGIDSICDEINSSESRDHKDCVNTIKKLKTLLSRNLKTIKIIKTQHKKSRNQYKKQIKDLQQKVCRSNSLQNRIYSIFNEDQVKLMTGMRKKTPKFLNTTLDQSYKIKFACGLSGYKELRKQGYPLPSPRTLNRGIENPKS